MGPDSSNNEILNLTNSKIGLEPGTLTSIGNSRDIGSFAQEMAERSQISVEPWTSPKPIPGLGKCDMLATINSEEFPKLTVAAPPESKNLISITTHESQLITVKPGEVLPNPIDLRSVRSVIIGKPNDMLSQGYLILKPESHEIGTSGKWQYNLTTPK